MNARPLKGFARRGAVAFGAGLLMGAVYWALGITSPAPPLIGLTGLLGIVAGERAVTALLSRRRPASGPEQ
ncbi:DUF1427 family protein [Actinocorallia populi]|uniref:DUF1427 family protein n=1 Tax=Actinocorallia populi TaxID=2079200 RepID=UPI0018E52E13|nr:DUF1427 family protein [Actinocorallia populi]